MSAPAVTLSPDITMTETQNPVHDTAVVHSGTAHSAAHPALPENLQRFLLTEKVVVVTGFVFSSLVCFIH